MGRTKIPYDDIFILTQKELAAVIEGHEIDLRDNWERERIAAFLAVSPYLEKKSNIGPQKLWPLPWDRQIDPLEVDKIDFREKVAKFKQRIEQHRKIVDLRDGKT